MFSAYFLNNLMYAIIEANPNLSIVIGADSINAMPFDTNTLNFALPGLAQHYGMVNHLCKLTLHVNDMHVVRFLPETNDIEVEGSLTAKLYAVGANLDKSDQLFLEINITENFVNLTGIVMTQPIWPVDQPHFCLDLRRIEAGAINLVYSNFGPVNIEMLERALRMELQTNANLFPITRHSVRTQVQFAVPTRFKNHFLSNEDWNLVMHENFA